MPIIRSHPRGSVLNPGSLEKSSELGYFFARNKKGSPIKKMAEKEIQRALSIQKETHEKSLRLKEQIRQKEIQAAKMEREWISKNDAEMERIERDLYKEIKEERLVKNYVNYQLGWLDVIKGEKY